MDDPDVLARARADVLWAELNIMRLSGATENEVAQREVELSPRIEEMNRVSEDAWKDRG